MKKASGRCAGAVTVGAKGQIVIPKEMRALFGMQPGDTLLLLADAEQGIAIPPKAAFDQLYGRVFEREARDDG